MHTRLRAYIDTLRSWKNAATRHCITELRADLSQELACHHWQAKSTVRQQVRHLAGNMRFTTFSSSALCILLLKVKAQDCHKTGQQAVCISTAILEGE